MNTISNLQTALKQVITEFPNVEGVVLVLGASPIRPRHVYELCFSHGKAAARGEVDFSKSRAADGLSRKVHLRLSLLPPKVAFSFLFKGILIFHTYLTGYSDAGLEGCWVWFLSRSLV